MARTVISQLLVDVRRCARTRITFAAAVLGVLSGCATSPSGPMFVPEADPPNTCALIYLYRYRDNDQNVVPHPSIDLLLNGKPLATLHYEAYTHVCLRSGSYAVQAIDPSTRTDLVKAYSFTVAPTDTGKTFRLVMFVSRVMSEYSTMPVAPPVLQLLTAKHVTVGTWKFEELDRASLRLLDGFRLVPAKPPVP